MTVHNHSPHRGPGIECPEVHDAFGRLKGLCLPVTLVSPTDPLRYNRDAYASTFESLDAVRAVAARRLDTRAPISSYLPFRPLGKGLPSWAYGRCRTLIGADHARAVLRERFPRGTEQR